MFDDNNDLELHVRDLIIDICAVLYDRGYEAVPVGAVMRLVGVGDDRACRHDDEYFALDESFQRLLHDRSGKRVPSVPKDVTLH